jgi:1,2-phenylacetyl-CoA epoxidase catalytic subunit
MPKDGMSKKTENKKKEKVVEDLTFGLKNKNKSKVVQQYVKEVTNKVMYSQVKVSSSSLHFDWLR